MSPKSPKMSKHLWIISKNNVFQKPANLRESSPIILGVTLGAWNQVQVKNPIVFETTLIWCNVTKNITLRIHIHTCMYELCMYMYDMLCQWLSMLCCVMSCYAMFCYAVLSCVVWCYLVKSIYHMSNTWTYYPDCRSTSILQPSKSPQIQLRTWIHHDRCFRCRFWIQTAQP